MANTTTDIQKLYIAYFNRPADPAGLAYWTASNMSITAIANSFAEQTEYRAVFAGQSTETIVSTLYVNLFGRAAEPAGLLYWVGEINVGRSTLGSAAINILSGAKDADKVAIDSKVKAADSFTTAIEPSTDAIVAYSKAGGTAAAKTWLGAVTTDATALSQIAAQSAVIKSIIDGTTSNIALTNGTDKLAGTSFEAGLVYTPDGSKRVNALQDEDQLTGTGASNTLTATLGNANDNGGQVITPKLINIQNLNVAFTGSSSAGNTSNNAVTDLDLQDATGLREISVNRVTSVANVARIENIQSKLDKMSISDTSANNAGTIEFSFGTEALKGETTGALNLSNVQLSAIHIGGNASGAGATGVANTGYEILTLNSEGNALNSVTTLALPMDTGTAGTIKITGKQNLTVGGTSKVVNTATNAVESVNYNGGITQAAGRLATIDASNFEGNLTLNLGTNFFTAGKAETSGVSQNLTVTGGKGNDTFILADAVEAGDSLTGGSGIDTLIQGAGSFISAASSAVTGIEKVQAFVSAGTATIDFAKLIDANDISVRNVSNTNIAAPANSVPQAATATYNLQNLSAAQAQAVTILHSNTGSNAITQNILNTTTKSTLLGLTIAEGVNTDGRFNVTLSSSASVTDFTLNDADSESNTIALANAANYAGTVTIGTTTGSGKKGGFINLDTSATGSNGGLNRLDISGADVDGSGIADLSLTAGQVRLVAGTITASAEQANVTIRVSNSATTGAQSITMGSGNDTVIFDNVQDASAGLSSADTVDGGSGTGDTLVIDGDLAGAGLGNTIALGASELANVKNFEAIRFVGTSSEAGVTGAGNYSLTLTDALITANNNGGVLNIINDNDTANNANNTVNTSGTGIESAVLIDARFLSNAASHFSYKGEEGSSRTDDRIIFNDGSFNGSHPINGGAVDNNTINNSQRNNDVIELRNATNASIADFKGISNIGIIELTNDTSVTQLLQVKFNDTIIDALVDSFQASDAVTHVERLTVRAIDNKSVTSATVGISLDSSATTAASALDVTLGRGANNLQLGAGGDRVVLLGNYVAGTYNATENGVSINGQSTAGAVARVVTDTINLGGGNDTLVTYGAIDLTGATLSGIENITNNSAVVVTASQYAALIAARAALSLTGPVLTFTGAGPHQLTIVDDIGGINNIDLSYISVTGGTLLYDVTSSSNASGGNTNNLTTTNAISVSGSGSAIAGTVGKTPSNGGGAVAVSSGGTYNGTADSNEQFMSSIPALNGSTIAGNAADTDSLTLTTAGIVTLNNGSTGGTISNIKTLNLANGANTITYNTSAGFATINGGTGDDTFIPNSALLPIVVNGGSGTDTIVLPAAYAATASGSGTFAANVTGFEKLRLTGVTNQTIDLQTLGNYSDVTFSGANGLTLMNVPANSKITLNGAGTATTIANPAFASGVNDIVNVTLTDGSTSGVSFASSGILAPNVETANITVTDTQITPTGAFNNNLTWLGNSVKTMNVSGNAGLTLSSSSTALTTVDASGITLGGFTWTSGALTGAATVKGSTTGTNTVNMNSATAGVNYTGGSGNDNVTINATVSSTAALGNGNNSLALNGVTVLGTYTAGTGTDSLAFFSSTPDISNATITGFENLTVSNGANITATIAQMSQFSGTVNAAGTETLNLTTPGTFNAFSTIEKYNLANGTNNFTSANGAVSVIGGTGTDTFNFTANQIINFITTVDGGNSTDTLNIGAATTQNIDLSTKVANIEIINVAGSIGTTSLTNMNGAGVTLSYTKSTGDNTIALGTGGQTLNLLGSSSASTTITGGAAVDTINLQTAGSGSETLIATGANMSNQAQVDVVGNFNATGTDYFKTGVNAMTLSSRNIPSATTVNYLTAIGADLTAFLNSSDQVFLITIAGGTAAGTYLFQNTGSDTSQFDNTDFFVQLTGTVGTITVANLIS
jgi:hypothetical protein